MVNCCEELCRANFYVSALFEGIAVALLTFIGGSVYIDVDFQNPVRGQISDTALAFAAALAGMSYCLKDVSGSHINPAITLAATFTRRVSLLRGFVYIVFQSAGGILGALMIRELVPGAKDSNLAMTQLSRDVTLAKGAGLEMIFTFVYAWIHFSSKGRHEIFRGYGGPLAIGLFYGVSHFIIIKQTGCSLNPARSLGPAVLKEDFKDLWIYWAGPMLAACFAGLLNDLVINKARNQSRPRPRSCSITCCKPSREEATLVEYTRHDELRDVIIRKAEDDA